MRTLQWCVVVCLAWALMAPSPGRTQTVSHLANPGTEHDITDISGFMTTGEDMGGLRVTAHFSSDFMGASETVNWVPGGAGTEQGSAVGTGWRLDETGDTWDSLWRLSAVDAPNLALYGLVLEGFMESDEPVELRATVFDRTDPFFGTDGSYRGLDLDPFAFAGDWSHVRVVYFDEVDNLADPNPGPQGDVYRGMQIQFGNVIEADPLPIFEPVPFGDGDELIFMQDTDTVGERIPNGDPGDEGLPEPAGAALAAIGLLATAVRGRSR